MVINQIIKEIRIKQGKSGHEMAKAIGTYLDDYLRWENGGLEMSFTKVVKACSAVGLSLVDVLTYNGNATYGQKRKTSKGGPQ